MTKRVYRDWALSPDNPVSKSTLWNWKKRGIEYEEYSATDAHASFAPVPGTSSSGICEAEVFLPDSEPNTETWNTDDIGRAEDDIPCAHHGNEASNANPDSSTNVHPITVCTERQCRDNSEIFSPPSYAAVSETQTHTEENVNSKPDERLYAGARITRDESLLLIMGHALKYHNSKEATENLLKVIEAHLPEDTDFPMTKYKFFKHFTTAAQSLRVHFYCTDCSEYVCADTKQETMTCLKCSKTNHRDTLFEVGNYFISIDLEAQLRELLEQHEEHLSNRVPPSYNVGDITGSPAYRNLPLTGDDISFTWSTDGVPVFESSQYSMWPLLLQVNELSYRERLQNQVLAGLWFGPGKPCMNTFLKPFVDEVNALSSNGFAWTSKSGEKKCSKVFPGPCTVDTVARCQLFNMVQFNGRQGCPWCDHEGEVVEIGHGHCRVYPILKKMPSERTDEGLITHAKNAEESGNNSGGLKGLSVLFFMSYFSMTGGFVVDYMHAVCLGFVRATACMWFNHKGPHKYHVGQRISEIDFRLDSLKCIWEISRLPRSIKQWKYWKASEWRNFLLFFSPIILKDILPKKYYKNWLKFVQIMHFLLAETVPLHYSSLLRKEMVDFLAEYQLLYGKERMTYNAHILIHMVDSVKNWGPLWNFSTFPFENMNGKLLKFFQGTRYVGEQICEKYLMSQQLLKLSSACVSSERFVEVFRDLVSRHKQHKYTRQFGGIRVHGKGMLQDNQCRFKKMSVGSMSFCVHNLNKSKRSNSYFVNAGVFNRLDNISMSCGKHGQPQGCNCEKNVSVRVTPFRAKKNVLALLDKKLEIDTIVEVDPLENVVELTHLCPKKCMFFEIDGKYYMCVVHENLALEAK